MPRPDKNEYFTFDITEIKRDTEKAVLVVFWLNKKEIWLPKSKIKIEGLKVTIPGWLKEEKGI